MWGVRMKKSRSMEICKEIDSSTEKVADRYSIQGEHFGIDLKTSILGKIKEATIDPKFHLNYGRSFSIGGGIIYFDVVKRVLRENGYEGISCILDEDLTEEGLREALSYVEEVDQKLNEGYKRFEKEINTIDAKKDTMTVESMWFKIFSW